MSETTLAGEAPDGPPEASAKGGRGPTRPAVKFADLAEDVAAHPDKAGFLDALRKGTSAKDAKAALRERRRLHKEAVEIEEGEIQIDEERCALLARAEELPAAMRAALVTLLDAEETEPKT